MSAKNEHEKSHLQSKKFVAFLLSEIGYFALLGIMLFRQEMDKLGGNIAFLTLVVTSGVLVIGYCLGQAYVDRYIRVALITMGKGDSLPGSEEPSKGEKA